MKLGGGKLSLGHPAKSSESGKGSLGSDERGKTAWGVFLGGS